MPPTTPQVTNPDPRAVEFISLLDKAIAFHIENENDPNDISRAVIRTLRDVRSSFAVAYKVPATPLRQS